MAVIAQVYATILMFKQLFTLFQLFPCSCYYTHLLAASHDYFQTQVNILWFIKKILLIPKSSSHTCNYPHIIQLF